MIIDSLVHITPDGKWFNTDCDASVNALLRQMDNSEIDKAAVVGLPGIIPNEFIIQICTKYKSRLLPVGSFNPAAYQSKKQLKDALMQLIDDDFLGIKLHPRLNNYDLLEWECLFFLREINQLKFPPVIWICSYLYFPGCNLKKTAVETFYHLVNSFSKIQFIIAHSCGPELLSLAHVIRSCSNVFLDLSSAATKYAGSSLELDIQCLANNFDKRLLFGSDFPEYSLPDSLANLRRILSKSKPGAEENICGKNLGRILGI